MILLFDKDGITDFFLFTSVSDGFRSGWIGDGGSLRSRNFFPFDSTHDAGLRSTLLMVAGCSLITIMLFSTLLGPAPQIVLVGACRLFCLFQG